MSAPDDAFPDDAFPDDAFHDDAFHDDAFRHCPFCREEFDPWVECCADCLVPLRPGASPALGAVAEIAYTELVCVHSGQSLPWVEMLVQRLHSEDVPAVVPDLHTRLLFGFGFPCLSRLQILVPSAFARRAREVLAD